MLTYTEDALIEALRQANGLAAFGHEDWYAGEQHIDERLRLRLRSWYRALLRTAPPERLPRRDLKDSVSEARLTPGGTLSLRLPAEGARLVEVRLPEWELPLTRFYAPGSPAERRQSDPLRRSTPADPVAIVSGDLLTIYGLRDLSSLSSPDNRAAQASPAARLESLIMTAPPADGSYTFDPQDFPTHIAETL